MLAKPGVTVDSVRKEIDELEGSTRQRLKTLRALLRALEAEAGPAAEEGGTDELSN